MKPRDRALITFQWLTGFRISECLSLSVSSVLPNGELADRVGIAPRNLKGGYGSTRWIPILPELQRALKSYIGWLRRRLILTGDMPLFLSRQVDAQGNLRPVSREAARNIVRKALLRAGVKDDGRIGTHSLRKTWARNVYRNSGCDIMILKSALGHSDISVTQKYLEVDEDAVAAAIRQCDFTRTRRAITASQQRSEPRFRPGNFLICRRTAMSEGSSQCPPCKAPYVSEHKALFAQRVVRVEQPLE